ncbi:MAG: glutamine amidotransferase-related protein, partial [Dolichospermum sp.]
VEIVEYSQHPFFIACQFHPEFQSRPNAPHPLFKGLVNAAISQAHSTTNIPKPVEVS